VYLGVAIAGFSRQFTHTDSAGLSNALLSLLLALSTGSFCLALHHARDWTTLTPATRDLLARYNTFLAVLIFTGFSFWGVLQDANVERMHEIFAPGMWNGLPTPNAQGETRAWMVDLGAVPVRFIFLAIVPAIVLVLLVFFDNSVVGMLTQAPEFRLKKGTAFHWDTVVLGVMTLVCGLLGLPPVNGVLPQSPMHVQALVTTKKNPVTGEVDICVMENRISPLLQSLLCGVVLCILPIVREVPMAVLWGLFLYLGVAGFIGNQFAERVASLLIFQRDTMPKKGEPGHKCYINGVPFGVMVGFTALQVACLGVIYYVSEHAPSSIIKCVFAILVVLLIPLRSFIVPLMFKKEHLELLDGHGDVVPGEGGEDEGEGEGVGMEEGAMLLSRLSAYPSRGSILNIAQCAHQHRHQQQQHRHQRNTMPLPTAVPNPAGAALTVDPRQSAGNFIKSHVGMIRKMRRREGCLGNAAAVPQNTKRTYA